MKIRRHIHEKNISVSAIVITYDLPGNGHGGCHTFAPDDDRFQSKLMKHDEIHGIEFVPACGTYVITFNSPISTVGALIAFVAKCASECEFSDPVTSP